MPWAPFSDGRQRPSLSPLGAKQVTLGTWSVTRMVPSGLFGQIHWTEKAAPFGQPTTGAIEDLDPIVLAVADQDPVLPVDDEGVKGLWVHGQWF